MVGKYFIFHFLRCNIVLGNLKTKYVMENKTFAERQKESIEREFWDENYRSTIIGQLESTYKTEIIREYGICEIVNHGDKILLKWYKRLSPLSDKELQSNYGK